MSRALRDNISIYHVFDVGSKHIANPREVSGTVDNVVDRHLGNLRLAATLDVGTRGERGG